MYTTQMSILRDPRAFTDFDTGKDTTITFPTNQSWISIIDDAKFEFELDNASCVYTTYKTETENKIMTEQRSQSIINALPDGQYLFRIKFIKEIKQDEWIITDKIDPIKTSKQKRIETISKNSKKGVLIGIER